MGNFVPGETVVHAGGTKARRDRARWMVVLTDSMMFIGSCSTSDFVE